MMSTPSSSVRLTQTSPKVTASVVKFRCLYTHDLRRKSKRWHDGYLRYHKFNKRVMVYDDQGNFIGDHHWRSLDEVQDGDEMELDKGVLIEVTENMGTTETDITNLYEKKKSSQGSPQPKNPVLQVPSLPIYTPAAVPIRSSASSQSFRSLNDLLGIKKTPIGHLVSPYEERNPPREIPSAREPERAPKRQKTSSAVIQTSEKGTRSQSQVIDLTDSNNETSLRQIPNSLTRKTSTIGGDSTADILPINRQQRPTVRSKQTQPQRPDISSLPKAPASVPSDPTSSLPTPEELVRTITRNVKPARPASNASKDGPPPMPPSRLPDLSLKSHSPTLPPETEITSPRGPLNVDEPSISTEIQSKDASHPIQLQRPGPPIISRNPLPGAPNQPDHQSTSQAPVRVVNNYVQPIQPANNQASANMPPPSRPSSVLPSGAPTSALRMVSGKPRRKLMYSALLPSSSRTSSPVSSDTTPIIANREPATGPPEQQPAALPDESSTISQEFMPSSSTQFILNEIRDGSSFKSPATIGRLTGRRSLDSPLRKSISDPTALTAGQIRAGGSLHTANKNNPPKEQGPWTSEALDLFDFWPAGRPKPTE